ncbi:MAG TPA: hypothetical protein VJS63_06260 [Bradyrhizobium sp.]|nr:hypothetical protein [Bradyrhizobium sp.]
MGVDAEHRPLVSPCGFEKLQAIMEQANLPCVVLRTKIEEETMGRGILLWLLGVPIPVIILLWLFFGR